MFELDVVHINSQDKAEVLIRALPYIRQYSGKTVVIKYGGNAMVSEEIKDAVMTDIVLLSLVGVNVVLVHGGGPEITELLKKIGKESRFVNGLRYTDAETVEAVQMVLAGKVNKGLVGLLQGHGGKSIGLSGLDGGLLHARQINENLGLVGEVDRVNVRPIFDLLNAGYIPVVATVAGGDDNAVYNVNADTAAARIAAELQAATLILMTDVRGLLRDVNDDGTLIPAVNVSEIPLLKKQGVIKGGMIPKIDCCVEAVRRGVSRAQIIDGRIPHSILMEMLTDEGVGTMLS
ncbi:MAG: acetylglutamate kinase [Oscillospiraceae bacterium]|jgi:acetylglutamate kinase|nr:acetylglutamate kinase [Oscillospiraceae bacterium]